MKILECITDKKFVCYVGGILTATYGVKLLRSEPVRKACVNGIAKCMKLQKDAQETFQNMKEDAQDICYDAEQEAKLNTGSAK